MCACMRASYSYSYPYSYVRGDETLSFLRNKLCFKQIFYTFVFCELYCGQGGLYPNFLANEGVGHIVSMDCTVVVVVIYSIIFETIFVNTIKCFIAVGRGALFIFYVQ